MQAAACQRYRELGFEQDAASMTGGMGATYFMMGDYDAPISYYRQEMEIQEALGNDRSIGICLTDLGHVHTHLGLYPEAMEYSRRGYEIALQCTDEFDMLRALNLIGLIKACVGDLDGARADIERGIEIGKRINNIAQVSVFISNLGDLESRAGNHLRAGELHLQGMELLSASSGGIGERSRINEYYCNAAFEFAQGGDTERAREAMSHVDNSLIKEPWTNALWEMAQGYVQVHEDDPQNAIDSFTRALEAAESTRELEMEAYKGLREAALKLNDLQAYVRYNTEFTTISDQIRGTQATQRIAIQERDRALERERQKQQRERDILKATLPDHVVHLLKAIFKVCDDVCKAHGLTKIKTIGDSYMAVAGVPESLDDHAQRAAQAAIDMMKGLNELELTMDPTLGDASWTQDVGEIQVRIGLHCGPVVTRVIGTQRLQFDVWGDTVSTASRMESTGEPGRIQVSSEFHEQLSSRAAPSHSLERGASVGGGVRFWTTERGTVDIKGKGPMTTYWLEGA